MARDDNANVATVCLSCKLCCTNGLFRSVPIRAEEVDPLRARHLRVIRQSDQWVMPFPCAAHDGTCSIYVHRPGACAAYRCDVLTALEKGEMRESDAVPLLARANTLVDALREKIPGDGDLWDDVKRYCDDATKWRPDHPDLLLDLYELRKLLKRIDRTNA